MFQNRIDAGLQLARRLKHYAHTNGLVLAIPRGGVPIGYTVAAHLGLPLDLVLTKKIGHPMNKEYAIGAASLTQRYLMPQADVSEEYLEAETRSVRQRLLEMNERFRGNLPFPDLKGKTVIVVDDGIATGHTLLVTMKMIHALQPAKTVIAAPVSSAQAAALLQSACDDFVCLEIPDHFGAVGAFYASFPQVTDEEVMQYIQQASLLQQGD